VTLQDDLAQAKRHQSYQNRILAMMWAYHTDLVAAGEEFSNAKTENERLVAKVVITERAAGERSAAVAEQKALLDDAVYSARVQYRSAEQRITSDREALRILHAALDWERTKAADSRAADAFQASEARVL
jgi:IS5 family transposase